MDDEKLKKQIGININTYRKHNGLTQAALADRLNYSDKAISKWERGESMPDVTTLIQLAEVFQISVNELLVDPDALPEETGTVERVMGKAVEKTLKRKADKRIILKLTSVLVWFVAVCIFVVLSSLDLSRSWLAFFYAVPVNAVVHLSLRSAWRDYRRNQLLISTIVWGVLTALYVSLLVFTGENVWRIFLLGIPGQAAVFLWFRLFRPVCKEEDNG